MDDVILSKIESLKRCVDRIKAKTPLNKDILFEDWDIQDIIVVNLERAIQLSVDIASFILSESDMQTSTPMTMAESFGYLHQAGIIRKQTAEKLQKSVGFRNIAVHAYRSIDWDVVYSVITRHLKDFQDYAGEIMEWLEREKS
jgi:uncharacterized protein YutE (UPF0331/DUF86 family)